MNVSALWSLTIQMLPGDRRSKLLTHDRNIFKIIYRRVKFMPPERKSQLYHLIKNNSNENID
jgi:hypothetical protein